MKMKLLTKSSSLPWTEANTAKQNKVNFTKHMLIGFEVIHDWIPHVELRKWQARYEDVQIIL